MRKWQLPRLTRGQKTVRNLVLLPLLLLLAWGGDRFYIRDPYLSFRRAEKQNLVGPSEIQAVVKNREGRWAVGVYLDRVLLSCAYSVDGLLDWPRAEDAPTLLPIPGFLFDEAVEEVVLAAVDLPQGTASARLEVELECWYTAEWGKSPKIAAGMEDLISESEELEGVQPQLWEGRYTVEGELLEDGGCLFRVKCEEPERSSATGEASIESMALACVDKWETYDPYGSSRPRGISCRMKAVFLDRGGAELGRAELSTPEEGRTGFDLPDQPQGG